MLNDEFGMLNAEFGMLNAEFGMLNEELEVRSCSVVQLSLCVIARDETVQRGSFIPWIALSFLLAMTRSGSPARSDAYMADICRALPPHALCATARLHSVKTEEAVYFGHALRHREARSDPGSQLSVGNAE